MAMEFEGVEKMGEVGDMRKVGEVLEQLKR